MGGKPRRQPSRILSADLITHFNAEDVDHLVFERAPNQVLPFRHSWAEDQAAQQWRGHVQTVHPVESPPPRIRPGDLVCVNDAGRVLPIAEGIRDEIIGRVTDVVDELIDGEFRSDIEIAFDGLLFSNVNREEPELTPDLIQQAVDEIAELTPEGQREFDHLVEGVQYGANAIGRTHREFELGMHRLSSADIGVGLLGLSSSDGDLDPADVDWLMCQIEGRISNELAADYFAPVPCPECHAVGIKPMHADMVSVAGAIGWPCDGCGGMFDLSGLTCRMKSRARASV